jgi:hypothetical protein
MAEKLMYKGLPLVRSSNELYYGNATDSHIIFIQILDTQEQDGVRIATKTHVQLIANDPETGAKASVEKESDRQGIYNALEIGCIWLKRALSTK